MNDASRSVAWTVVMLALVMWAAHLLTGCASIEVAGALARCAVHPITCN